MRYVTVILAMVLMACGPNTDSGNNGASDAGSEAGYDDAAGPGCDFDEPDTECCDDPDYEARHMDICLQAAYAQHIADKRDEADSLNDQRVDPQLGDVLRNCERPADDLVNACREDASPGSACLWGAFPRYPEYDASVYELQCNCAQTSEGLEQLRQFGC